jgi:hypothetical protein
MGRLAAEGFAEAVDDGDVDLEVAIGWHLGRNHYPPVPSGMIPVCIEAIEYARGGWLEREVDLRGEASYRGADEAPVWAIVEQHHLDSFI